MPRLFAFGVAMLSAAAPQACKSSGTRAPSSSPSTAASGVVDAAPSHARERDAAVGRPAQPEGGPRSDGSTEAGVKKSATSSRSQNIDAKYMACCAAVRRVHRPEDFPSEKAFIICFSGKFSHEEVLARVRKVFGAATPKACR